MKQFSSLASLWFVALTFAVASTQAADQQSATKPAPPKPTFENVAYGTHERQVLDFYQAKSNRPRPLLFFIHGGGWVTGDKKNPDGLAQCLAAGISVVSINYRYSWQAQLAGVKPPVQWPLHDAARALQFVRSKAKEWNIDKARIGASGGSAGACSSLWLAFHDDMADRKSDDAIARESTRLWCAAVVGAQTSLDPLQLKEWTPNSRYGGHAFGFMDPNDLKSRDKHFAEFLAHREELLPWIREYSPIEHVSADDPPVYLIYSAAPAIGQEQKDPTHTANYGVKLQEKCKSVGVPCELVYPGAPGVKHATATAYLIETLKGWPRPPMTPTEADVRYGPHERNVLDFYQAKSDKPTPLLFIIHGGGWTSGDKHGMNSPAKYLAAGISVVAINYRFTSQAGDVKPPVKAPLDDAARALQFVRSKAKEWNIDKQRVCASGGSAGACSSLWLAFHDDLADPGSSDPIARESTRLTCAAVVAAQTSLDPRQMKEWTPNSNYGGHAFGFTADRVKKTSQFDEFLAGREKILPWIAEYSPYALVTKDDPPVYLIYGTPPALGMEQKDPTHTSNFGVKLQEHCKEIGVACELVYPGAPDVKHPTVESYVIDALTTPAKSAAGK
ncbi:MAG TPA: alpha/beta hydrolase [Tepidisphaeraceae bacterium]|jgi:acetyl esterase/lipase|nr:alpha/beta hydrolase [Tepidisphaeraceae bacterium]